MPEHSLSKRLWYRFLQRMLQYIGVVGFGVRFWGMQNIPKEGAVLVVSSHQSHFDPPLVGMGCKRRMNYLARKTLFRFTPFRWLITSLDAIPVDLDGIGLGGFKESLRRLKRGEMVLVFPEGTRSTDGEIAPFRPGFTSLAIRSKAFILPVAIEGAYDALPRHRKIPRLSHIHVCYGRPMTPQEVASFDERQLLAEVERRVRACQQRLRSHPVFRGGHRRRFAEAARAENPEASK